MKATVTFTDSSSLVFEEVLKVSGPTDTAPFWTVEEGHRSGIGGVVGPTHFFTAERVARVSVYP